MLQIDITGVLNGELTLEVNGHPNNGNSSVLKSEEVHWRVKNGSGVKNIHNITWKTKHGSTDIFSTQPPRPQTTDKKNWKAKVNTNAEEYDVYVYNIEWIADGSTEVRTYDPIISIRPSTSFVKLLFGVVASLFCVSLFFSQKKKRNW